MSTSDHESTLMMNEIYNLGQSPEGNVSGKQSLSSGLKGTYRTHLHGYVYLNTDLWIYAIAVVIGNIFDNVAGMDQIQDGQIRKEGT